MKAIKSFSYLALFCFFTLSCNNKKPPIIDIHESCGILIGQEDCTSGSVAKQWFISLENPHTNASKDLLYDGKVYQNVFIVGTNLPVFDEEYVIGKKYKFQYAAHDATLLSICLIGQTTDKYSIIRLLRTENCN
uniref:Uncharacterized protein n=1 Tax=Thermoflexibacter ruber TaxID=1003 RepID=A0A1I2J232_9BACT|nr:hypothetical protein [Thermoflexibacter ruber]SFF48725.1 hypothetical protein SAMN04488541_10411 [Thermoflexibacter ruber]